LEGADHRRQTADTLAGCAENMNAALCRKLQRGGVGGAGGR
jgi:hypothetical protein